MKLGGLIQSLNDKGMQRFSKLYHDELYDKNKVKEYKDEYEKEVEKLSKMADIQEHNKIKIKKLQDEITPDTSTKKKNKLKKDIEKLEFENDQIEDELPNITYKIKNAYNPPKK
jgi:uncharacterized protein Yka (UPF0111/DUF47 family)